MVASSIERNQSDKFGESTSMEPLFCCIFSMRALPINNKITVQILVSDSSCTDNWRRPRRSIQTQIVLALVFVGAPFKQTGPCFNLRFLSAACCEWFFRGVGLSGFEPVATCLLFATAQFKICGSCFLILSSDGTVPACDHCRKASLSPSNNGGCWLSRTFWPNLGCFRLLLLFLGPLTCRAKSSLHRFDLFSQACNLICEQEELVFLSLACCDTSTCPASFQIDFFESTSEGELVPSHKSSSMVCTKNPFLFDCSGSADETLHHVNMGPHLEPAGCAHFLALLEALFNFKWRKPLKAKSRRMKQRVMPSTTTNQL